MHTICPCHIHGSLAAPASKSMMQRAIAIAALAQGQSVLHGYTSSNDSDAALQIAHELGAEVFVNGETITIKGGLRPFSSHLNCGESGLGIRMFTPIASLCSQKMTLHGEGSLKSRPIKGLEEPLRDLGVTISTNNGFVPVMVEGPMKGGEAQVDGSLSSQILTGLLIASPLAKNDVVLNVSNLKSKPYIDMTLRMMADFGVKVQHENYKHFEIFCGQRYQSRDFKVEGDWSGAAFLLVAGALGGQVRVENLNENSTQADKAIVKALVDAGAEIKIKENAIEVIKQSLNAFTFDATDCPDLFPPLVSLAVHCNGMTEIKGVERLFHKESNRAEALQSEFGKLGVKITIDGDVMKIEGGKVHGGIINPHNDHRMAMAAACTAILAEDPIQIENPECVAKSYPNFFEDFEKIVQCL